nr:hypothetical protein [Melioribacteraceae bacterium]
MELTLQEKKAFQEYISAIQEKRIPKDILRDCRNSVIALIQNICIEEYHVSPTSQELKEPKKLIITKSFFSKKDINTGKIEYHSQLLEKVFRQINIITDNRNSSDYSTDNTDDDEFAIQCKSALKVILKWYINKYKKIQLSDITNLNSDEKKMISDLFKTAFKKTERIIERETYYVILLIDSSQSMLWPYLKDQSNFNKENTKDYMDAVLAVQNAMQLAHEKSLTALRGSSICKDGYLKIYQYTFNHHKKLLNAPEDLSPVGLDRVAKINVGTYHPEGKTALYDVIYESIKVVYDNYLMKAMHEEKRIDKVVIGVITDGEDTVLDEQSKSRQITEIKKYLNILRGDGDFSKCFLVSSVLIGLTGNDFSDNKLKEIKRELGFDESISINQLDEHSIRQAFKLFSTNALNV